MYRVKDILRCVFNPKQISGGAWLYLFCSFGLNDNG